MRAGKEPRAQAGYFQGSRAPQYLLIDKGKGFFYAEDQAGAGSFHRGIKTWSTCSWRWVWAIQPGFEKSYQVTFAGEEVVDGKKTALLDLTPKTVSPASDPFGYGWISRSGVSLQLKATETGATISF